MSSDQELREWQHAIDKVSRKPPKAYAIKEHSRAGVRTICLKADRRNAEITMKKFYQGAGDGVAYTIVEVR